MIVNAEGTLAISNLRWVDQGNLWSYALGESQPKQERISDSNWLTLVQGTEDYFAVVHHFEDGRVRLTLHSYREIPKVISSIDLHIEKVKSTGARTVEAIFTGEDSAWSFLPRAYVVRPFSEACLLLISRNEKTTQLLSLPWSYDSMYQAVLSVTEVPSSSLLVFSIQRDSEPLLFDPTTNKVIQKLPLAGRHGNPQIYFRRSAEELWASDYDTLVRLDSRTWDALNVLKLQNGKDSAERLFVGEYCFNKDERLCLVARPYSGDILGVDSNRFVVTLRAETGGQPLEVGTFRDNHVIARDWKTGQPLQGILQLV